MFEQPNANGKQTVEKLEQAAETAVQRTKEAVGMADDRSSIAEEDEPNYPEGRRKSLAEELGEENLDDESWANIKDHHEDPKTEERADRSNSTPSVTSQKSSSIRSPSPKRSKIPRRAKEESRSRSPVKQTKSGPSAIPRPSSSGATQTLNTNGTKQQTSTSTSSPPASEKGAKGVPTASNNTAATTKDTENTKPAASETSESDASNGSVGSVKGGSGANEDKDVEKVESDTNVGHEQDSSADVDLKEKKNSGEEGVGEELGKESLPKPNKSEDEGEWFGKKLDGETALEQHLSTTDPMVDGKTYAEKVEGVEE
jgi:hypothetical protein